MFCRGAAVREVGRGRRVQARGPSVRCNVEFAAGKGGEEKEQRKRDLKLRTFSPFLPGANDETTESRVTVGGRMQDGGDQQAKTQMVLVLGRPLEFGEGEH